MEKKEIIKLIKDGENETNEYKESFDKETIETAGAFANTKGGIILIGVSDKGKVKGVQIGKESLKDWANQISQSTDPRVIPEIETVEIDGKNIAVIQIKEFPIKPVSVKGRCFRRVKNSNRVMTPQEIAQMHMIATGTTWDSYLVDDKTIKDIDPRKVEKYIALAQETGRKKAISSKPIELLTKMKFIRDGKPTWAAVLLFGKETPSPRLLSPIHCGRFKLDKTIILDDRMIDTDLISLVDETMDFLTKHINVRYDFDGKPRRKETWEYPLEALREAIINAIVHRDYPFPSNIQVEVYDDRIQILNPGKLLQGLTISDLYKREHESVLRNALIAQVFYDIGFIEKYGSGTTRMIELCRQHGLPDPEFEELSSGLMVVFRKDVYTEEYLRKKGLNERQVKAVMYVKERGRITNKEYQEICDIKKRQATDDLKELESTGTFERIGVTGKGTYYVLRGTKGALMG